MNRKKEVVKYKMAVIEANKAMKEVKDDGVCGQGFEFLKQQSKSDTKESVNEENEYNGESRFSNLIYN